MRRLRLVAVLIVLAAPPCHAQALDALLQEFGAYDPKKGALMVAECEARVETLTRGQAEYREVYARYLRSRENAWRAVDRQSDARERLEAARQALTDATISQGVMAIRCQQETLANPGADQATLSACRENTRLLETVLPPRRQSVAQAEAEERAARQQLRALEAEHEPDNKALFALERRLGLNPFADNSLGKAIEEAKSRCSRLRAWASLGARAAERQQSERSEQALTAVNQCRFSDAEKLIGTMAAGEQRTAIEGVLRSARQHEENTRVPYENARGQFARANALAQQGRAPDARALYTQALGELRSARANTRCPDSRATIDRAIANVEAALRRVGAAPPAAPSPPPSAPAPATPPPAGPTDQQCADLLRRAQWASTQGSFAATGAELQKSGFAEARQRFNEALTLFRQGASLCRQGRYPAEFSAGVQETTRKLAAIQGRP
jgi:hypothetical protein